VFASRRVHHVDEVRQLVAQERAVLPGVLGTRQRVLDRHCNCNSLRTGNARCHHAVDDLADLGVGLRVHVCIVAVVGGCVNQRLDQRFDGFLDAETVREVVETVLGGLGQELVLDGRHEVIHRCPATEASNDDAVLQQLAAQCREVSLFCFVRELGAVRVAHLLYRLLQCMYYALTDPIMQPLLHQYSPTR